MSLTKVLEHHAKFKLPDDLLTVTWRVETGHFAQPVPYEHIQETAASTALRAIYKRGFLPCQAKPRDWNAQSIFPAIMRMDDWERRHADDLARMVIDFGSYPLGLEQNFYTILDTFAGQVNRIVYHLRANRFEEAIAAAETLIKALRQEDMVAAVFHTPALLRRFYSDFIQALIFMRYPAIQPQSLKPDWQA